MNSITPAGFGPSEAAERPSMTTLSPQEASLVDFLADNGGFSDSLALRMALGIANISTVAANVSRKFAVAGDTRRIVCKSASSKDAATGRRRATARWYLTTAQSI
jgi:hypothetical protein